VRVIEVRVIDARNDDDQGASVAGCCRDAIRAARVVSGS
jgi:hypothetical protein